MSNSGAGSVEPDFEWCYDIVDDVSRTFALTISELDEPLAREICVGYLLCRVADTIEDDDRIPPDEQARLLELYHDVIDPDTTDTLPAFMAHVEGWIPAEPGPDWTVVAETPRLIATFTALPTASKVEIRPAVQEMVEGMTLFVDRYAAEGGLRIQTMEELEEYCWYVAGTVGHLVTGLVSRDSADQRQDRLYETADSFGLLLQLVNVAKDLATDYHTENNVYVPQEVLQRHGLETSDIADDSQSAAFEPVITDIVDRAEQYTDDARDWLETMPRSRGNTLGAWAIPFLLAVGTIRELKTRPRDVITEGDVKVSRTEVQALLRTFTGDERPSLERIQQKVAHEPLEF
jgi:farnesyl-diphosphate farnesyltransferase